MRAWRERLAAVGEVVPLDYPYAREGRRRPDRQPVLVAAHREALAAAREVHRGPPVLVGKSMGSRIGCHVALEVPVRALVCLGYPLRGQNGALRDEVLLALRTPILFVQGTRDSLCPLDGLRAVLARMSAPHELHVVEGGNHSLELTKTALRDDPGAQERADAAVLEAVRAFVERHAR